MNWPSTFARLGGMEAIDVLIADFFSAFDNRAGAARVDTTRACFHPDARVFWIAGDGVQPMTVEQFISPRRDLLASGSVVDFHEWEVSARLFRFGPVAARISLYAKRWHDEYGAAKEGEGWKAFLLCRRTDGWQIIALAWADADGSLPIDSASWTGTAPAAMYDRSERIGSCHCGEVRFRFVSALESPFTCNCSFCARRGAVLQKVAQADFELLSPESELGTYGARSFSKHHFCRTCGLQVFTRITRANEVSVAVNLLCVPSVDMTSLDPVLFDGATRL